MNPRPQPPASGPAPRLLVIALAGIGDTLMATPVLRELRRQRPDAVLDVLVMWRGSAELLAGNPHVTTVRHHDFIRSPRLASLRFVLGLRRPRYDLSFNLHPQGRREYRWIARLIGAHRRLSHEYENQGWLDRWLVTDSLPQDYGVHCIDNNLRLLTLAGMPPGPGPHEYELHLGADDEAAAAEWLRKLGLAGRPWLGVHVGSGGTKNLALRRWPVSRYAELFRALRAARPGLPVVLFGGPDETAAHAELAAVFPDPLRHAPATRSLREAAALLRHATAFLSVDTAFMHLATAVRVPHQFVIETPTLNPPVHPRRPDWIRIPNPAVGDRALDFYRYDGRPIAGTPEELRRIMESVTVGAVLQPVIGVFPPTA